mmetsp:Transcript_43756/g.98884  ORF Transcript_43756/g.98884 Transcript_43756/m.98884 type:complete len:103 (+) Transcript_43756:99-407(+)
MGWYSYAECWWTILGAVRALGHWHCRAHCSLNQRVVWSPPTHLASSSFTAEVYSELDQNSPSQCVPRTRTLTQLRPPSAALPLAAATSAAYRWISSGLQTGS